MNLNIIVRPIRGGSHSVQITTMTQLVKNLDMEDFINLSDLVGWADSKIVGIAHNEAEAIRIAVREFSYGRSLLGLPVDNRDVEAVLDKIIDNININAVCHLGLEWQKVDDTIFILNLAKR